MLTSTPPHLLHLVSDDPHPFPAPGLDLNLCPLICRSTSCSNLSHQNQTFGFFLSSRGRFQGPGKDRIKAASERDQSGPEVPDAAARPSLSAQTTRNKRQKFRRSCYEIKAWNVSPLPKVWIEEKISFVGFGSFISDKKKICSSHPSDFIGFWKQLGAGRGRGMCDAGVIKAWGRRFSTVLPKVT